MVTLETENACKQHGQINATQKLTAEHAQSEQTQNWCKRTILKICKTYRLFCCVCKKMLTKCMILQRCF